MKLESKHPPLSTFSLASLTDIVMLLLVFFLLSSSYIVQPGVKIELPASTTAQVVEEESISVTISGEGVIYVQNERTRMEELSTELREHIINGASQTIIIRADRKVLLQTTVEVIDRIKTAGGERFLIATQPEE
ncbi:MAG: biopolymer transporter ExbD [Candidatus Electryoneaceae bacterium]|nr:biopolymer transporter ExbD [Candidatus Electryoneaceae bacterium]